MSKFIGNKRIENEEEQGDFVVLTFKDGSTARLAKCMLEVSATRSPVDDTALWDRQLTPVAKEILNVLMKWNVQLDQMSYLVNLLQTSLQKNSDEANEFLWGHPKEKRTMADINDVLNKKNEQREKQN